MSYYENKGTSYPGQKPQNSFGAVPPGTPSAPSAPLYNHSSPYPHAPSSFGSMPLPSSSPFSNTPYPSMPQPGMPQPTMPQAGFPSSQPMYNPSNQPPQSEYHGQQPYPSQPQGPYAPQSHQSYPSQHQPYTSQPHQPYSSQSSPHQPYPSQSSPHQPYPSQSSSHQPSQHFSHHTPPNHGYGSSGGSMYPALGSIERPGPTVAPSYGSSSSPYSSGGHSGGRGSDGNFAYGGSAYSASSPGITKAPAKRSPTVGNGHFDAKNDAEVLRKAMKGFGTDEKAIIGVLAHRSNEQRLEIASMFKTLFGKDLVDDLKSETSGNFKKLLKAMMMPLPQYYAKELHEAMSGVGTDETVLIEVLCTMSNHEIEVIKECYAGMYDSSLEDDLRSDTSGAFQRLMVSLSCANRDESYQVDPAAAANDARQLLRAGEMRFGTDESTFNAILVQRNFLQLNQIFAEYQNITGHDIEKAIENEFSGDIQKGLLSIVKVVRNRAGFFAEQIYKSMKGAGTQDERLIRLIVTRSEFDMGEIKQAFAHHYGQSLEDCIASDCSGNYKKCLIALIS